MGTSVVEHDVQGNHDSETMLREVMHAPLHSLVTSVVVEEKLRF